MSWAKSRHPPSRHPVIPTSLLSISKKFPAGELEMLACLTPSHPLSLQALPAQTVHCGLLFPLPSP